MEQFENFAFFLSQSFTFTEIKNKMNPQKKEIAEKKNIFASPWIYSQEGIDLNSNYISQRNETIKRIEDTLKIHNIILIRSPPFIGKTSMCTLLEERFSVKKKGSIRVHNISFLQANGKNFKFDEHWQSVTGHTWEELLYTTKETLIIIDEVWDLLDLCNFSLLIFFFL